MWNLDKTQIEQIFGQSISEMSLFVYVYRFEFDGYLKWSGQPQICSGCSGAVGKGKHRNGFFFLTHLRLRNQLA